MRGTYNKDIRINPSARGEAGWEQVITNFEWLKEHIDELEKDIKRNNDRKQTFTRVVLSEGIHSVTLLKPQDHENCKLISAFAQAGDNVDLDNIIVLSADGGAIAKEATIKAGEKSGKVQSFNVSKHITVGRYEKVVAIPNSVRKVIVVTEWQEI